LYAEGLSKRFGRSRLFRDLSFELGRGEALVIRGRNGSGKSTLIRILGGLLQPDEGRVRLEVGDRRQGLAMCLLEQSFYTYLTVAEHLELAADLRTCPSRTPELLAKVGLAKASDKPTAQLSSGMKARLRLALAIQPAPKLLLLDEPGAALDEEGKQLVKDICREQAERGAVVLATNDPEEGLLGERVLQLG
jgi:ABC-type multidrug transport system ATPase subunit